jgi:CheY-like chemotaxis protein/nitrogen-specific signal transduction histidine kinase
MAARKAKTKPRRKTSARRRRRETPGQRAVEAALAGIAHDIRTPLTGMVALAELLAASDLRERERGWASALKSGAEHLAALSTLIIDAAKADAAGLVLQREPFAPRALAEAIGQALTVRAARRDIEVDIAIGADLPPLVAGDALRLRAALENLADNAVKFTSAGKITFAVTAGAAARNRLRLVFEFTDSGIGMSAAELRRLFRPFTQANDSIAQRYGGAGLGLVFVRRIAKAMGGGLDVVSAPNKGSTFRLTVSVERVAGSPVRAADARAAAPARTLTILCAEDNPYGRVVMNTVLGELGHRVNFVESGEAAVRALKQGGYDAVLMDVTLAGLDGLAATRRIRALPGEWAKVPIIGISGRGNRSDEQAAREAGMNAYLAKPVSPARLAQVLNEITAGPSESGNK